MRIWLTAQFDDAGIQEIETLADPIGNVFSYIEHGLRRDFMNWYQEGKTWHRTKKQAIAAAKKWRDLRITTAQREAARLVALPEPTMCQPLGDGSEG